MLDRPATVASRDDSSGGNGGLIVGGGTDGSRSAALRRGSSGVWGPHRAGPGPVYPCGIPLRCPSEQGRLPYDTSAWPTIGRLMRGPLTYLRLPAALAAFGAVGLLAPPAGAFCRSTTCQGACVIDAQGCKASGVPLFWPGRCVGVS